MRLGTQHQLDRSGARVVSGKGNKPMSFQSDKSQRQLKESLVEAASTLQRFVSRATSHDRNMTQPGAHIVSSSVHSGSAALFLLAVLVGAVIIAVLRTVLVMAASPKDSVLTEEDTPVACTDAEPECEVQAPLGGPDRTSADLAEAKTSHLEGEILSTKDGSDDSDDGKSESEQLSEAEEGASAPMGHSGTMPAKLKFYTWDPIFSPDPSGDENENGTNQEKKKPHAGGGRRFNSLPSLGRSS